MKSVESTSEGRPETPSPLESVGSASARIVASVTASSSPRPGHARRGEARDVGRTLRNALGQVSKDRSILKLRSALILHRVERSAETASEARDVEQRMSLAVSDVARLARRRHEDRTEPIAWCEDARELGVSLRVDAELSGREAVDRAIQARALVTRARK